MYNGTLETFSTVRVRRGDHDPQAHSEELARQLIATAQYVVGTGEDVTPKMLVNLMNTHPNTTERSVLEERAPSVLEGIAARDAVTLPVPPPQEVELAAQRLGRKYFLGFTALYAAAGILLDFPALTLVSPIAGLQARMIRMQIERKNGRLMRAYRERVNRLRDEAFSPEAEVIKIQSELLKADPAYRGRIAYAGTTSA